MLSTDRVVHELYGEDEVIEAVTERFGAAVAPGGVIDRGALAKRAFAARGSGVARGAAVAAGRRADGRVAGIVERPRIRRASAVVEVPLLFESGMDGAFDATIAVVAGEDVRVSRAGGTGA